MRIPLFLAAMLTAALAAPALRAQTVIPLQLTQMSLVQQQMTR